MRVYRYLRDTLFVVLILVYTLLETLIWEQAVRPVFRALAQLRLYRRFLEFVRNRASREAVLILFTIPFIIGEVLGVISGLLVAKLYFLSAAIVYACKIPLIVAALAILENGKEKLFSYGWFEIIYMWMTYQLQRLHNAPIYLQTMAVIRRWYLRIKNASDKIKRMVRSFFEHS